MKRFNRYALATFVAAFLFLTGCENATLPTEQLADDKPVPEATFDQTPTPDADPAAKAGDQGIRAIPGEYIVVLKDNVNDVDAKANELVGRWAGQKKHVYKRALKGFSAKLSDKAVDALRRHPAVELVEPDYEMYAVGSQNNATWGLDRIDQRDLPLDNVYNYTPTGAGVTAYIVDTGIRTSHNDFGGRASVGYDAIGDGQNGQDCNGHGTHVAGTVGGTTYGVAKNVNLVAVRVLSCSGSGSTSGVIAGVDWVAANATLPAVANMSLGGGASTSLDNAVRNAISAGVTFVVAAGNDNRDACNYSPARTGEALTVGSTTSSDGRSSFSNYGTCLDVFAPGSSITSAWHTSNSATNTISGTSMAAPHAAGVAALYLQDNTTASPATVNNAITSTASSGRVSNAGSGSPNLLLYSPLTGGGTPPPPPPPPPGDAPCTGCEQYSGSLSGTGAQAYQPNGTYFYSGSGTHTGYLRGPSGADFDLYLQKWNGWWGWTNVASGTSSNSDEDVTYSGTSGYYVWRIYSYSGSGSYDFYMFRP